MYEWFSSDGLEGRAETRVRTPTDRYFPFTTVMTFIIEAGFNYYLAKLYNQVETAGGTVFVNQSTYGDETNDFNRAFGTGQTFKLQITGSSATDDYIPKDYISADIGNFFMIDLKTINKKERFRKNFLEFLDLEQLP